MLIGYNECIERYGSKYNLNKIVKDGKLFKLEKGIYSDKKYVPEYKIITYKYPSAVFTMDSAFFYHGLTDVIPEKYYLMTGRGASKIRDERVVQLFENSNVMELGVEYLEYDSYLIRIYNKERMLLELLRNRNKISFDYYKEILNNYRKIIYELDIPMIQDFASKLPKKKMIMEALELEIF